MVVEVGLYTSSYADELCVCIKHVTGLHKQYCTILTSQQQIELNAQIFYSDMLVCVFFFFLLAVTARLCWANSIVQQTLGSGLGN